jgi:hypothetical protein
MSIEMNMKSDNPTIEEAASNEVAHMRCALEEVMKIIDEGSGEDPIAVIGAVVEGLIHEMEDAIVRNGRATILVADEAGGVRTESGDSRDREQRMENGVRAGVVMRRATLMSVLTGVDEMSGHEVFLVLQSITTNFLVKQDDPVLSARMFMETVMRSVVGMGSIARPMEDAMNGGLDADKALKFATAKMSGKVS